VPPPLTVKNSALVTDEILLRHLLFSLGIKPVLFFLMLSLLESALNSSMDGVIVQAPVCGVPVV
jgi:hypothetical protein